ncbi:hypothetical protein NECAME_07365 [Necator americanus]|uniref:Uncharacterized protein n=1 Tax=Necator americanus TaxID=51031 RepID=W2TP37_NECAM|nr:hypothetical protein NECAME_07365 [Necator americanus]ETN83543.1 hypothetical protein NECAME_07365 [Necator americanus]
MRSSEGRPSELVKSLVKAFPRVSGRDLASELGVSCSTTFTHLREIGKSKKLVKWVPHELTESKRMRRLELSSAPILRNKSNSFLDRIVTCDE